MGGSYRECRWLPICNRPACFDHEKARDLCVDLLLFLPPLFRNKLGLFLSPFSCRRVCIFRAMDSGERRRLRERDEPCPSDIRLREDVQRGVAKLFPQVHHSSIFIRGRVEEIRAVRGENGGGRRARGPQESSYPSAAGNRSCFSCLVILQPLSTVADL